MGGSGDDQTRETSRPGCVDSCWKLAKRFSKPGVDGECDITYQWIYGVGQTDKTVTA